MIEAADVADVDNDSNTTELLRLFCHYDSRSNVARLTAGAQTVVESYEYAPYGNVSIKDKSGGGVSTTQVGNPFDFQRRRRDVETGLMYFRARHYDPITGHWLERDPLGFKPGANWREFVCSNPIGMIDPFGTDGWCGAAAGYGAALTAMVQDSTEGGECGDGESGGEEEGTPDRSKEIDDYVDEHFKDPPKDPEPPGDSGESGGGEYGEPPGGWKKFRLPEDPFPPRLPIPPTFFIFPGSVNPLPEKEDPFKWPHPRPGDPPRRGGVSIHLGGFGINF
jgi:RHS repeat-associated protein